MDSVATSRGELNCSYLWVVTKYQLYPLGFLQDWPIRFVDQFSLPDSLESLKQKESIEYTEGSKIPPSIISILLRGVRWRSVTLSTIVTLLQLNYLKQELSLLLLRLWAISCKHLGLWAIQSGKALARLPPVRIKDFFIFLPFRIQP